MNNVIQNAAVSIEYGGGYYGGGGPGSMGGDMGMIGGSSGGFIDGLKQSLSFLPNWAAILIIALGVILSAMLVGWIFGKIIGSILYPDPDKQSILTKQQKFIALGGAILAIGLTLFALTYVPKPKVDDIPPAGGEESTDSMKDMADGDLPTQTVDPDADLDAELNVELDREAMGIDGESDSVVLG